MQALVLTLFSDFTLNSEILGHPIFVDTARRKKVQSTGAPTAPIPPPEVMSYELDKM